MSNSLPRYKNMDNHTKEQRRKNMQAIKNKDSKIEQLLRKELWARGLRYHKNSKCECFYKDIYRPE